MTRRARTGHLSWWAMPAWSVPLLVGGFWLVRECWFLWTFR